MNVLVWLYLVSWPRCAQVGYAAGGNLDNKHFGAGCTLYFPVNVPGACAHSSSYLPASKEVAAAVQGRAFRPSHVTGCSGAHNPPSHLPLSLRLCRARDLVYRRVATHLGKTITRNAYHQPG